MSVTKLYCVDCYVHTDVPLSIKCLERCDLNGPVDTKDGIAKVRERVRTGEAS